MSPVPSTLIKGGSSTVAELDSSVDAIKLLRINQDEEDAAYHREYVASRIGHYEKLLITRSKRLSSPERRRALSIIKSYKAQLSGASLCEDPEGISEDSPYVKGTTLLKPAPRKGIYKDEEDEIDLEFNLPKDSGNDFSEMPGVDEQKSTLELRKDSGNEFSEMPGVDEQNSTLELPEVDFGDDSIVVGPALQLISVSISNKTDGSICNNFETHGEISVTDDKNNIFYMYKREPDNLDLLTRDWNFLHIIGCPIAPVVWGKLKVDLSNKGCQIFDKAYDVEKLHVGHDEKLIVTCAGKDGYCALLEFSKMNYAVMVNASMYLRYSCPTGEQTYQVHGTIKVNKILCFKRDEDHPDVMHCGESNRFSQFRRVFAVSVFSPWIDAEVELFSAGLKIVETIKLHCCGLSSTTGMLDFPCQDKRYTLCIGPQWLFHTDFFGSRVWTSDMNVKWSAGAHPFVQIDELKTAAKSKKSKKQSKKPPCAFVEVFSVFIGGGDLSAPPALCGTVVVEDREDVVYIFSRSRKRPDKLLSSDKQGLGRRIMALAWPDRWFLEKDVCIHLKLKDYQGNQVCRGSFEVLPLAGKGHDKRLRAFIKGKNGYFAAVHYSTFINGKKARLSVRWEGHHSIVVCGSIFAEYSNYDYPCAYDKEYYRNIIFKRSRKDGVRVKGRLEMPLSKRCVSAPSDCEGLIVYVNLRYRPILGYFSEQHSVDAKLQFDSNSTFATEQLGPFLVKVQWE